MLRRLRTPKSNQTETHIPYHTLFLSNRFTAGTYGVLYAGNAFETALFETIHHHVRFMARTVEAPGWTSQFREIILSVSADLPDLRSLAAGDPADRKSVVSGKSVSVRVVPGGRRIIKKKTN